MFLSCVIIVVCTHCGLFQCRLSADCRSSALRNLTAPEEDQTHEDGSDVVQEVVVTGCVDSLPDVVTMEETGQHVQPSTGSSYYNHGVRGPF